MVIDWKDTLLPGASRQSKPSDGVLDPGWVLDTYGTPQERNDWVMGPNGVPVISGSSEAQPGAGPLAMAGPSPGFFPVDAGQYGSNPWFAGRVPSLSAPSSASWGVDQGVYNNDPANWTGSSTGTGAVGPSPLGAYGGKSAELVALLKALGAFGVPMSGVGDAPVTNLVGGGLRIAE